MPYIKRAERLRYSRTVDEILDVLKSLKENELPGHLNYVISKICWEMLDPILGRKRYDRMNSVIGALECAKAELYRRIVAPYEDLKVQEEGDIKTGLIVE